MMSSRPAVLAALTLAVVCAVAPASALAVSEDATLNASFSPDRLGTPTTITFGFHLATSEGTAPPPLTSPDLKMPAGITYTTTTLGLAICRPAALLAHGLAGCPPNSRLGVGSAYVEVPFGTGTGHEIPEVQAVAGPSPNGNLVVLFYANGLEPVSAQLTFSGEVLPAAGRFGSQLAMHIPLVTSVPGGPDVSIVSVTTTIGPSHLIYYRHLHGHLVRFTRRACPSRNAARTGAFRSPPGSASRTPAARAPRRPSPALRHATAERRRRGAVESGCAPDFRRRCSCFSGFAAAGVSGGSVSSPVVRMFGV